MKFKVIRRHFGDRPYEVGDEREADEAEVQHLIGHVLAKPGAKAAPPVENKAVKAPKNKAAKK